MQAHLIRIGNSRGVRLPKAVIEEAGLKDAVEVTVRAGVVMIRPVKGIRAGWAAAAAECHAAGEDGLVLGDFGNAFDGEW